MEAQTLPDEVFARYGGEEFALIMPNIDFTEAMKRAETLCKVVAAIQLPAPEFPPELRCTASLGVASYPKHGRTGEELFAAADKALYLAKGSGRNVVKGAEE